MIDFLDKSDIINPILNDFKGKQIYFVNTSNTNIDTIKDRLNSKLELETLDYVEDIDKTEEYNNIVDDEDINKDYFIKNTIN